MMLTPQEHVEAIRWLPCKNAMTETIPAFSLVRITGLDGASGLFTIARPDTDSQRVYLTGPFDLAPAGSGHLTRDWPAYALYETTDGTPLAGEEWGAGANSYKLRKNQPGFRIIGGVVDDRVVVEEMNGGGGAPANNGIPARVTAYNCTEARATCKLIMPAPALDGTWIDVDGTTFTQYAYHFTKGTGPYTSGGPQVAVDTPVRLFLIGTRDNGTAIYSFDCPAGPTCTFQMVNTVRCVGGAIQQLRYTLEFWNGSLVRVPCDTILTPCDTTCPTS